MNTLTLDEMKALIPLLEREVKRCPHDHTKSRLLERVQKAIADEELVRNVEFPP
jgi:hypothetical protein